MSNNVAEASIALTLDATKLNQGMKNAATNAKKGGSEIAKSFKDSSREKIGEVFGGGSVLAMGTKAGWVGALVAGTAVVGQAIYDNMISQAEKFNKEMERSDKLNAKLAEKLNERLTQVSARLGEFDDIVGTPEGLKKYREELEGIQRELSGARAAQSAAHKEADKMNSLWNGGEALQSWLVGDRETQHTALMKNYEDRSSAVENLMKKEAELAKKIREAENPADSIQARTAIRQAIKAEEEAYKDLTRSVVESQIAKMKDKFGFKDDDPRLKELRDAAEKTQAFKDAQKEAEEFTKMEEEAAQSIADAQQEAADWAKDLNIQLIEQSGLVKNTAELVKLDELAKRGADTAQLERIRALIQARQTLNNQYQQVQALERGSAQEVNFRKSIEFNNQKKTDALEKIGKEQVEWLKRIYTGQSQETKELI